MSNVTTGTWCSAEDLARSNSDPSSLYCLKTGDVAGLIFIAMAGVVSLTALTYVLRRSFTNLYRQWTGPAVEPLMPVDFLMLALFVADMLQSIGGVVNIHWVIRGKVQVGSFCRAQGIIQTLGETGVALANILITTVTIYCALAHVNVPPMRGTLIGISICVVFLALIVTLGNTIRRSSNTPFVDPTPFWCWISQKFFIWQLLSEYLWLWIALFWSVLAYISLYFLVRRNDRDPRVQAAIRNLLWYPLIYGITILPITVIRLIGFVEEKHHGTSHTPSAAVFTFCAIFTLSGLFNVILLMTLRPQAGLFRSTRPNLPQLPLQPIQH